MAHFVDSDQAPRLIQIRAIGEKYPIYGEVETLPAGGISLLNSQNCLVENNLILQYGAKIGDSIKLGKTTFKIVGTIESIPGEGMMVSELSPRVIIPFSDLKSTGLIAFGSRVQYLEHFAFPANLDDKKFMAQLKAEAGDLPVRFETSLNRQERIQKLSANLFHFLNLSAILSLILGGIGVGSAIHVYINKRLKSAATLKCIGAPASTSLAVYVLQILLLGFSGSVLGVIFGLGLQYFLPQFLQQFLPIEVEIQWHLSSILLGLFAGTSITFLSSLPSLSKIFQLNPLQGLRPETIEHGISKKFLVVFYPLCALSIVLLCTLSSNQAKTGILSALALLAILLVLAAFAKIFLSLVRRSLPQFLSFPWQQGLKNLYRPNNQSLLLVLALGTGVFVISLFFLLRQNLLHQVQMTNEQNNPNFVLFDIQHDQVNDVAKVLQIQQSEVLQQVPIIDLRLRKINGKEVKEIIENQRTQKSEDQIPMWTLMRTYRCTFRDQILDTEKLLDGKFTPQFNGDFETQRIPVSAEQRILKRLKLKIGDEVDFELSGIEIPCLITSVREVDWMQMRPNFFFVFPEGPLDEAPQMNVIVSHATSQKKSVEIQKELSQKFPNVSFLDLTLVIQTLNKMLDKLSLSIRFMAGFSIITGLVILMTTLRLSQQQRKRESTLLKIIGAKREQMRTILLAEFTFLALISASAGVFIAYPCNYLVAVKLFNNPAPFNWLVLISANIILLVLTLAIGFFSSKSFYQKSSLETLRE